MHAINWILHPAIACFELLVRAGKQDLRMAIWLWHNDPNRTRGKATAFCYAASGGYKITLRACAGLLLIGVVLWLLGLNAIPAITLLSCILVVLATAALALLSAGGIGCYGLVLAYRAGLRLWIDGLPSVEYATTEWPPVRGNQENHMIVSVLYPVYAILIFGVLVVPEKWIYHAAACLLLSVPPILWLGHKTIAETVEQCYNEGAIHSEEEAHEFD